MREIGTIFFNYDIDEDEEKASHGEGRRFVPVQQRILEAICSEGMRVIPTDTPNEYAIKEAK